MDPIRILILLLPRCRGHVELPPRALARTPTVTDDQIHRKGMDGPYSEMVQSSANLELRSATRLLVIIRVSKSDW